MKTQAYIINTTELFYTVNQDTLLRCLHHLVGDSRVYSVEFYKSATEDRLYKMRIEVYDTETANHLRDEIFDIEQKSSIALEDYEYSQENDNGIQENDNELPF